MIRTVFTLTATIYGCLHAHAPTNRLAQRLRTHPTLTGVLTALGLAMTRLLMGGSIGTLIRRGAPGWLNLAVLMLAWDGFTLMWLAVAVVVGVIRHWATRLRAAHPVR